MVGSSASASCGELGCGGSGRGEVRLGRSTGGGGGAGAGISTRAGGGGGGTTGATSATRGDGEGAGAGGGADATGGAGRGAGEADGAGAGSNATGGGGGAGRAEAEVPGMKEKSSASDDEIHGTCSPREARVTPTRVRLSVSSAIRSGTRISFNSSCTNRLRSRPVSEITDDSAAEYMTSVPFGAMTGASPAEKVRKRRS